MTYAFFVNIGALSSTFTTFIEQRFSFWCTFLLPILVFLIGFTVFVTARNQFVILAPAGSVVVRAFKVFWIASIHDWTLDAAKPSYQERLTKPQTIAILWDDMFVDELRQTLIACRVFIFLPFYFVAYSQMQSNFVSQAGTMETHGIPNDIMYNINPLTVLILLPLLDRLVYPFLHRIGIPFYPITKITLGFVLCSCAMIYAALVQHIIYQSPPCYEYPLSQDCHGGKVPNQVHIGLQVPAYVLIAFSEVFLVPTSNEYAFTKAPVSMKSLIAAMNMSTVALGSLLAITITPWVVDPKLTWVYASLAIGVSVVGLIFWLLSNRYNKLEIRTNRPGIS